MTRIKNAGKTQPKIKHTGKTKPLVDSTKVAKGLGAEKTISFEKKMPGGRRYIEVARFTMNNRKIKKRIYDLVGKNLREYMLLGTAKGMDFFHCIYLAARHGKNFWKQVYGYIVWRDVINRFEISFFAKK